jgi:signal transduction histidine kinase
MRSPIVSLLSLVESYRMINNNDSQPTQEFIDNIELCARKNLKYSEDFLQLTRAENISQEVFNLIDMHGIIDGAYTQVFGFASRKGVTINVHRADEDCWMLGDAHLIERAITNILSNIVKYSPDGSEVTTSLSINQGIRLEIQDAGLGIPKESIPYLFEPYFRVKDKQKKLSALNAGVPKNPAHLNIGAKSYGLGLSFVHTVVTRHGGAIHVESELDVGSQFIMNFPLHNINQ